MAKLPKQWWDIVLDGRPYTLNVVHLPYRDLASLRAAVYREAETRLTNVVTNKEGPTHLHIQAWGTGDREPNAPSIDREAASTPPQIKLIRFEARTFACDCGQRDGHGHPLTCSIWTGPKTSAPAPVVPDPTVDDDYEPLTPEEEDALLGPCTCGQSPKCLPSCARFN